MNSETLMHPSTKLLVDSLIRNPANSIGFNGPNNSGKLQIAEYMCRKILKLSGNEFDFKVDIFNSGEQSGIDDIRDLKKKLAIKAQTEQGGFGRAVIFEDFHKISIPAQNSILKLLEEPPNDTILILLVDTKKSILPTIVSRLQWVDVLPLDLKTLEKKYGSQYEMNEIKQAYLLSDGYIASFEDMLQGEKNTLKIAVKDVKEMLKLKRFERISKIESILNSHDYSPEDFLTALQKIYLTLLHKEIENGGKFQRRVLIGLDNINKTKESLKYNSNQKLVFTNLFYKI